MIENDEIKKFPRKKAIKPQIYKSRKLHITLPLYKPIKYFEGLESFHLFGSR